MKQGESDLQDGIYIPGRKPRRCFLLLTADFEGETSPDAACAALAEITETLTRLRAGEVADLRATKPGDRDEPIMAETIDFMLGYGASFFTRGFTSAEAPHGLVALQHPATPTASIPWAEGVQARAGEGDICLQLTGDREHAVARGAVEIWKTVRDRGLPVDIRTTYSGFARDDRRSWLGFHDGVSNICKPDRRGAIECGGDPDWNRGGTYMAFLRLQVDLEGWRELSRVQQEVLVGRDKLSGQALAGVDIGGGDLRPRPFPLEPETEASKQPAFVDPPETGDAIVEASHIHRANQSRASATTHSAHRIFRQGFEYLEGIEAGEPSLGLNFVSFQAELEHFWQVLGLHDWLGGVNFGGRNSRGFGEPPALQLTTLRAGGVYAIPPRAAPFPGARLCA